MAYAQRGAEYIFILRRVRALSKPIITPDMEPAEILQQIRHNASRAYTYMKLNNRILNELVYSRDAKTLTDEDIAELSAFAEKLFHYSESEDAAVAYKVHCLLLEAARTRGDEPFIIRELYYCGLSLLYVGYGASQLVPDPLGEKVRAYFSEGAAYLDRFAGFDARTQGYIIRCLANRRMLLPRNTREECDQYFRVMSEALDVIDSPYYRSLAPSLLWDTYKANLYSDSITLLPYLRRTKDKEVLAWVVKTQEWCRKRTLFYRENSSKDAARTMDWRRESTYRSVRYMAGHTTPRVFIEYLLQRCERADSADHSTRGIAENITPVVTLLSYWGTVPEDVKKELRTRVRAAIRRSMRYIDRMPPSGSPRIVNSALLSLAEIPVEAAEAEGIPYSKFAMNYLLAGHKPTYVHSRMVAAITRELTNQMLRTNPMALAGVLGYTTAKELWLHADEVCAHAYRCGLYHDIGKSMVLMFVANNTRRLINEEFACIQQHPVFGWRLLQRMNEDEDLALAALYHHTFYDNSGGYPPGYAPCPAKIKGIVDIISVADSLDAGTDSVGRCYTMAKTYEVLVEELRAQRGTRYSPAVVALFDDEAFYQQAKARLYSAREKTYVAVYGARKPADAQREE